MSVNNHFSMMPNINTPRSRMKMEQAVKGSFDFGKLVPLDAVPIIPGDTMKVSIAGIIRAQFIKPLMDDIEANLYCFFVPSRLLYDKFESWYTSNTDTGGDQGGSKIDFGANAELPNTSLYQHGIAANSIGRYFGKPLVNASSSKANAGYGIVNIMKERAYWKIWTDWFIPRQFVTYDRVLSSPGGVTLGHYNIGGSTISVRIEDPCLPVCKNFDYFTAATLSPQYSTAAVTLPLGDTAPVTIEKDGSLTLGYDDGHTQLSNLVVQTTAASTTSADLSVVGTSGDAFAQYGAFSYQNGLKGLVDLSQATAATVNDLRYAIQLQKFAERSNYGNRFFEHLEAHYGVTSPDARLQRAEYLGHKKFLINIDQVVSTAGYAAGTTQQVGETGAVSLTGFKFNLATKGFVEPGYLVVLLSTRQLTHCYSQGILREDSKLTRFEFYSPEFANLGDQEVKNKEVFLQGVDADDQTFGFQEHWAEDRYRFARVCGLLDPNATGSLDYWTLADKYATKPDLGANFLWENRDNIQRAVINTAGPDFLYDIRIQYLADREMPVYTIPGLMDHFGTH